jgi:hypothetical protein
MEEAPENGKESSHSAYTSGMNIYIYIWLVMDIESQFFSAEGRVLAFVFTKTSTTKLELNYT